MGRPTGSKNENILPEIVRANEADRLEYLANLLLEIAETEIREAEEAVCSPS